MELLYIRKKRFMILDPLSNPLYEKERSNDGLQ
jgi:hypothetical protein